LEIDNGANVVDHEDVRIPTSDMALVGISPEGEDETHSLGCGCGACTWGEHWNLSSRRKEWEITREIGGRVYQLTDCKRIFLLRSWSFRSSKGRTQGGG